MREITKIDHSYLKPIRRKRVAAYARVSSGKDSMIHSLSAQISYYNHYIGNRGDWELAGIYADEGITGTKEKRPEFQRMLSDCRAGKIDMILTKSVTRFARNTVTILEAARELKALGIDIYFEKEDIHTLSADGELMLTLLASFAQEESWSASENMKWRIRKKFERGHLANACMLGYRLKDGILQIVPEEAKTVRQIFHDYLSGMGRNAIVKKLIRMNTPTRTGRPWNETTIYGILRNEAYTGNLLLQKTYKSDHITKKCIQNRGELPMYYVENAHEAIINKDIFEQVQQEIARRAKRFHKTPKPTEPYIFTSMIRCGFCGGSFNRKIADAGFKWQKPVWRCHVLDTRGKKACQSRQIPEKILLERTMGVLGVTELSRDIVLDKIAEIQMLKNNRILYIFRDGHTAEVTWEHPPRSEGWTEKMRQQARERRLKMEERRHQNDNPDQKSS